MGILRKIRDRLSGRGEPSEDLTVLSKGLYAIASNVAIDLESALATRSPTFTALLSSHEGKYNADHFLTVAIVATGVKVMRSEIQVNLHPEVLANVFSTVAVSQAASDEFEQHVTFLRARWNEDGRKDCDLLLSRVLVRKQAAVGISLQEFAGIVSEQTLASLRLQIATEEETRALLIELAGAIDWFARIVSKSIPPADKSVA